MNDSQSSRESRSEQRTSRIRWDQGPWHGALARCTVFLVSLCVAAGGGWVGYNHGTALEQADRHAEAAQAGNGNEVGIAVDTAVGAVVGFIGTEVVLSFGLVNLQRRYAQEHLESPSGTDETSV